MQAEAEYQNAAAVAKSTKMLRADFTKKQDNSLHRNPKYMEFIDVSCKDIMKHCVAKNK